MEIKLSNCNLSAIIDDEDFDKVMAHTDKWSATFRTRYTYPNIRTGQTKIEMFVTLDNVKGSSKILRSTVARIETSNTTKKKNKLTINLGWAVLGYKRGFIIDHINDNPLDNRKCNLRVATTAESSYNKRSSTLKKDKGYYLDKGLFRVSIRYQENNIKKSYSKRGFKTAEEASLHANEMYRKFHGEFAKLNII